MKPRSTKTSIIGTLIAVIIMAGIVGLGYAKLKSEKSVAGSYVIEQTLENDPYGRAPVLIDVLNYPVRGEILGAEIGLTKEQAVEQVVKIAHEEEDQSRELRWTRGLGAEEFNKRVYAIMRFSDEKLKQVLNPLQYVRFRDWIVEELNLQFNHTMKINMEENKRLGFYKEAEKGIRRLKPIIPITFHQMNFLKTQLKLSQKEAETIEQLIYQTKQEILPLREEFVGAMADQSISLERIEEIGRQIAQKISLKAQERESDILKKLPANKRKLYKSLVDAPAGK